MPIKLAVLGSTRGTDMQAIIDAIGSGDLDASIEVVISNKASAGIIEKAKAAGIRSEVLDHKQFDSREAYDEALTSLIDEYKVDLILLIGWMRIFSSVFIKNFPDNVINVHPSLLPKFAGGMDVNVHQAVLDAGETETGCTIHMVDETVDGGKILLQKSCSIDPDETAESLKKKVQKLEGEAFVEVIRNFEV